MVSSNAVYELWDVFTAERYRGNPLAVFPDASRLPESRLGDIAREMNLSETVFVYPRPAAVERREGVRARIFSKTGAEMPFAGHPVLGTAFALWSLHRRRTDSSGAVLRLQLPVGVVPVEFQRPQEGAWEGIMTQPDPVFAEQHEAAVLAPHLGLRAQDVENSPPLQTVSTGRPNVLVMVKNREALRRAAFDWRALDAYFAAGDRERGVYLLTHDVESRRAQFHARKVTRSGDDPVTGSAAGCAIAWLVRHGLVPSGQRVILEQGSEVNRPGFLLASALQEGGRITQVRIGGQAIRCATGMLDQE